MDKIMHITSRSAWEAAQRAGAYRGDTLDAEGFVHCSLATQVVGVADARFRGRTDLVLLLIDPARVTAEIKVEGGFPHVYGPLNLDAIDRVLPFQPKPDGTFALPAGL